MLRMRIEDKVINAFYDYLLTIRGDNDDSVVAYFYKCFTMISLFRFIQFVLFIYKWRARKLTYRL